MVHPPRGENDENAIAPAHSAADHVTVVGRPRNNRDAIAKNVELGDALFTTDTHHLVAAIECVLDHVAPELPRRANDADLPRSVHIHGPNHDTRRCRSGTASGVPEHFAQGSFRNTGPGERVAAWQTVAWPSCVSFLAHGDQSVRSPHEPRHHLEQR